jgi:hypothetical protein
VRPRLLLCLGALLLTQPVAALAQYDSTTIFGRVLTRRMAALDADSAFLALSGGRGVDGVDWDDLDFAKLDDHALTGFFRVLGVAISRMSVEECKASLDGEGDAMIQHMATHVSDSAEAETWVSAMEEVFWGILVQSPVGRAASLTEMTQFMVKLRSGAEPERLNLLNDSDNDASMCASVPWLMQKLTAQEPAVTAPMLRALSNFTNSGK